MMLTALDLPVPLPTPGGTVTLRRADATDLEALMRLLADDAVSASRGDRADESDLPAYRAGLVDTLADPSNDLVVAVGPEGAVVAMMQLTRIPGLARRGATRLLIEAVRVSSARRSTGIGSAMMRWCTDVAAPALGAGLVQLTSDEARTDAHRFYERLGFVGSHRGFKYAVGEPGSTH
jgi:GNAT superfamily N-acetyltransferase